MKVLITGGAGFIGSHIADGLIEKGHKVRIFDILHPQVHGEKRRIPDYLNPKAEFILGDVCDYNALKKAVAGMDAIYHEAAAVGVGQSMYQVREYTETNVLGTANLLHILANEKHRVRKLIVASSMSIYGEGKYECQRCGIIHPALRREKDLQARRWEMRCPVCRRNAKPVPTDEEKPLRPTSVYAVTKRDQEELCLSVGIAYKIPTVALRYFNVYGPRQALSNPYTGVCAIFSSRILNGKPPVIWEDGEQKRDFVHVRDIAQANLLALEKQEADYQVFNVGTGEGVSIGTVAKKIAERLGMPFKAEYPRKCRAGDIRHGCADISKIKRMLGYSPSVFFDKGVDILIEWAQEQKCEDKMEQAMKELRSKGLAS
ncbi:MAG TPA: SDR family NAD(P)-dependent oxidoreductase [Candidatus Sumerlaeia bacterium]|nr:SDR family NAD(P)-dependent oxidoreductase [Candidatus Sumerlaeia bacterium]